MKNGKVISKREKIIFRNEYKKWLKELCGVLIDYRENMIEVMKETNLKTFLDDEDFTEMAKMAFFHKLLCFYQQEAVIEETIALLNQGE